ncbi:MAG: ABC transporter permease [Ktedonobacteraceae bacterium]
MVSLVRADLFKLRKRAMGWVMLVIVAAFAVLEMLSFAIISPGSVNYSFPGGFVEGLAPVPIVGTFVLIVLGAMLIGSEYGYDTWKNLLIRRAGRAFFILSKWLSLLVATGVGLIVLLALGQLTGLLLDGALHLAGPALSLSPGGVLIIILMQALVPLVAGTVALMGAVIGRSSVAGIVIGIAWFSIDSLLGALFPLASVNSATIFIQARLAGVAMASNGSIDPVHLPGALQGPLGLFPIAVVVFYLVVPVAVAVIVFRQRDMLGAT